MRLSKGRTREGNARQARLGSGPYLVATLALLLAGCGRLGTVLTVAADGGGAAVPDAGGEQSGDPDAGFDGGAPDAGFDGGAPDAGSVSTLRAGAAAVDITPGPGVPLGGYGGTPRRKTDALSLAAQGAAAAGKCPDPERGVASDFFTANQGAIDPLYARALVLDDGATRAALIKIDAIGMTRSLRDDLVPFAEALGIAPELFAVVATHSHSGPATLSKQLLWELLAEDCFNGPAYRGYLEGAARALREAAAALRPAKAYLGVSQLYGASQNRRDRPGIFDPELALFRIDDDQGHPLAALFNFAIHGTVYGQENLLFSADVMGEAERRIAQGLPSALPIFTNAAEGDVSPANGLASGDLLGDAVLALWSTSQPLEVKLAGVFEDVQMPPAQFHPGCMPVPGTTTSLCDLLPGVQPTLKLDASWLSEKGPFQAWRIGPVALAFIPGEPLTEIGWEIKSRGAALGFTHTFIIALANDHLSYMPTLSEYNRGQYEGQSTLYGPTTGQVVVDSAAEVLGLLPPLAH